MQLLSSAYSTLSSTVSWAISGLPNRASLPESTRKVKEVAKDVLAEVGPHLLAMSPWFVSRLKTMHVISMILFTVQKCYRIEKPTVTQLVSQLSVTAGFVDSVISVLLSSEASSLKNNVAFRVCVDSLLLLGTAVGSGYSLYSGTKKLLASYQEGHRPTSLRIKELLIGGFLAGLGIYGLHSACHSAWQLSSGIRVFASLDEEQQRAVLKFRALHELAEGKSCSAVVIDGMSESGRYIPATESIYQMCHTRVYKVESSKDFCRALRKASEEFGAPITHLSLFGHASSAEQTLGTGYTFSADPHAPEIACMQEHLAKEAQVILLGCNTATQNDGDMSLAEKLSKALVGKEILGIAGYYHPYLTSQGFVKGKFSFSSYFPVSSSGIISTTSMVTFLEDKKL